MVDGRAPQDDQVGPAASLTVAFIARAQRVSG